MKVEIDELVDLPDGDGLLVRGSVDGEPAEAQVWKSHVFGDHAAVNKQRAADAKAEGVEIPLLEKGEQLRNDQDRKRYLAVQLVAAAAPSLPELEGLTGSVSI